MSDSNEFPRTLFIVQHDNYERPPNLHEVVIDKVNKHGIAHVPKSTAATRWRNTIPLTALSPTPLDAWAKYAAQAVEGVSNARDALAMAEERLRLANAEVGRLATQAAPEA